MAFYNTCEASIRSVSSVRSVSFALLSLMPGAEHAHILYGDGENYLLFKRRSVMVFYSNIKGRDVKLVPLINFRIPAGFESPAVDYIEERIDLAKELAPHPLSTFYAYCEGDSMIDAHIPPNSILVIDKALTAKSGDIIVAFLNGGWTVKYIKWENEQCFLIPANKNYPVIEITADMEMIIWGVVTNVVINTKNIRLCSL